MKMPTVMLDDTMVSRYFGVITIGTGFGRPTTEIGAAHSKPARLLTMITRILSMKGISANSIRCTLRRMIWLAIMLLCSPAYAQDDFKNRWWPNGEPIPTSVSPAQSTTTTTITTPYQTMTTTTTMPLVCCEQTTPVTPPVVTVPPHAPRTEYLKQSYRRQQCQQCHRYSHWILRHHKKRREQHSRFNRRHQLGSMRPPCCNNRHRLYGSKDQGINDNMFHSITMITVVGSIVCRICLFRLIGLIG